MSDSAEVVRDYYREQGGQIMLEEILEELEIGGSQLSGQYRDGWMAALESLKWKQPFSHDAEKINRWT